MSERDELVFRKMIFECWRWAVGTNILGTTDLEERSLFYRGAAVKLEKAIGEPCVEQERCSQPPRPWIVKHMGRGGFKNTNGFLPFWLWDITGPASVRSAACPGEDYGDAP